MTVSGGGNNDGRLENGSMGDEFCSDDLSDPYSLETRM